MADSDDSSLICEGRMRIEFAVRDDKSMPAKEYLDSLNPSDRLNVVAYLQQLADSPDGMIHNQPKIFKRENETFFALKRRGLQGRRIRIVLFRHGRRWILTHGFDKPAQAKWNKREFTKATKIRNEHLTRERSKTKMTTGTNSKRTCDDQDLPGKHYR
jgi:hypothetical protein